MSFFYIKQALRTLSRQKVFTCINVLGLALSLACCIVLSRYLYRELSADRHAIDPETIYVVFRNNDRGHHRTFSLWSIKEQYTKEGKDFIDQQIVETCDIFPYAEYSARIGDQEQSLKLIMVDSTFTHFFNYSVEGDAEALNRSDACWISEECVASSGLTPEEIMGKDIEVMQQTLHIAGIFHHPEGQVLLNPDLILPASAFRDLSRIPFGVMRVRPDFDAKFVNQKLSTFDETDQHEIIWQDKFTGHQFVSWQDYYFEHETGEELHTTLRHHGNATLCWILAAVLLLILVVGLVNFINLYMVQWQRRQREAGVRLVFGRHTSQLFFELWSELMLLILMAMCMTWILVEIFTPWIETMMGSTQAGTHFDILLTVGIIILLPLLTMVYPLVQQLRTSPLKSLQRRASSVQSLKSRTIILGIQYFITFCLVVMSLWMRQHLDFLLNSPLGFDADRVLLVRPTFINESIGKDQEGNLIFQSNREEVEATLVEYTDRLNKSPLVEAYCYTESFNLPIESWGEDVYFNDKEEDCMLRHFSVSRSWFDVFGIQLQEGTFPKAIMRPYYNYEGGVLDGWIANRSALLRLGYQSLDGAYARRKEPLIITGYGQYGNELYPIKALVNDHYAGHRTLGASACIYHIEDNETNTYWREDSYLAIRVRSEGLYTYNEEGQSAILSLIEQLQEELCPNQRLEYHWMSDIVVEQYHADRVMANVYSLFSTIAVIICCLGLFGLSLFDIRQRYKEIAIRKAHGAHRKDLYLLLGKKYLYLLLLTFLLSVPVTYLLIHRYTESFIESAPLTPIIFIEALGIVVLITLLTLIYQLEKAAKVNVASVVKTE